MIIDFPHLKEVHAQRAEEGSVVVPDGEVHARSVRRRNPRGRSVTIGESRARQPLPRHSHAQLGVVQQVLHRVEARELVLDLRAVGDGAGGVVRGGDHARDVDVLDVGEVGKLPASNLTDGLETTEHLPVDVVAPSDRQCNSVPGLTLKLLLQAEMELSLRGKRKFSTGGSAVQFAIP